MGKGAQRTQEVNKTPTPPPQQDQGATKPVGTALGGAEGNPSPPPSLTANIEAETDKKSETPAVQALIEGMSLAHHVLVCCSVLHCFTVGGMSMFLKSLRVVQDDLVLRLNMQQHTAQYL